MYRPVPNVHCGTGRTVTLSWLSISSWVPSTAPALKRLCKYLLEWMIKKRESLGVGSPFSTHPWWCQNPNKQSSKLLSLVWALSGDKTIMFETGIFCLICGQELTGEPLWGPVRIVKWQQASVRGQAEVCDRCSLLPALHVKLFFVFMAEPSLYIHEEQSKNLHQRHTSWNLSCKVTNSLRLIKCMKLKPH